MKTIEINLYKFEELSEDAKDKAIEKLYDINVDYQWWECIYDDAKTIGLKITGFDIDRGSYCSGDLIWAATEVCNAIIKEHGKDCDTYKLAVSFLADYDKLVEKYSDGIDLSKVAYENEYDFDQDADELESEFLKDLLGEYCSILSKEYDYLTSRQCIIDAIESNDYDFTENGELA